MISANVNGSKKEFAMFANAIHRVLDNLALLSIKNHRRVFALAEIGTFKLCIRSELGGAICFRSIEPRASPCNHVP
jgi:hypothetical protein